MLVWGGILISFSPLQGQLLDHSLAGAQAIARVKMLHQFVGRFNAVEDIYGRSLYPKVIKEQNRSNYIGALFLPEFLALADTSEVLSFVDQVVRDRTFLAFRDPDWYAKAVYKAFYHGKEIEVDLILKVETNPDNTVQWIIVGGHTDALSLETDKPTRQGLPPNANELNFIRLSEGLTDPKNAWAFTSRSNRPDYITVILFLIQQGTLKLEYVKELTYHFLQIPGWQFSVGEFNREGMKSGWLIYNLVQAEKQGKNQFIQEELHISGQKYLFQKP